MREHTETEATHVEFHFESDGDSMGWLLRQVDFRERLSAPYRLVVELDNSDPMADATELIGKNCTISVERPPLMRQIQGVIVRVERGVSIDPRYAVCLIHVAPAMALLQQVVNTRIFQEKSVPDILEEVLGEDLGVYDREVDISGLQASYEPREYTVQYQESDFDFCCRLMEQEGIAYRFNHDDGVEKLMLSDTNKSFDELETPDGGPVRFTGESLGSFTTEPVSSFRLGTEISPTKVSLIDFDWTAPSLGLDEPAEGEGLDARDREVYVYQRGMTVTGYAEPSYETHDIKNQSTLRLEELRTSVVQGRGQSVVTGLAPGMTFTLEGHQDVNLDGEYAVVSVDHRAMREGDSGRSYSNTFICIPVETTFRPRRRVRRPRVHGVQTATVVGPAGEEIHTDVHGRIKVQFHWDRLGENDEHSSVWMRVAQSWAGAGWGFLWIPRIGMEVIVTFVDGDPDRPLVTGCVYNGEHPPPYTLPDEKTKSTIKSNSSLGGDGFNEFRFEDKKDEEEIFIHAEKDFNEVVENDHNTLVHNDQTNEVDNDQTETIHNDQFLTVDNNREKGVTGDEKSTIDGNRTEHVSGDETITIDGDRTETVTGDETITLDSNRETAITKADKLSVDGKREIKVKKDMKEEVDGKYDIKAKKAFKLEDDKEIVLETGSSSITLKEDGTIEIKGDKIKIEGDTEVELKGAGSKGKLDDSEFLIDGSKVSVKGSDKVAVEGGAVELN